ncbi:sigma-70 family RNA polymerase sigma factor [Roseisolibacter sp. H3M3-2]|uniref:RNA polymerase sigma factor n=1 Tax=Roseisolibacter sp. H3M3-2 TaxID=3031323 RepID=UPI0023D98B81|nr:sigma-70 family RNA polymerase sigma factor [Roseisolibacter sp. H3M3-2]MDF1503440.1 sigma-70 family RNA polymerase sigma factor [Roseisolibacter sp. H3M3-2]
MSDAPDVGHPLRALLREHAPPVPVAVERLHRDFAAAEDAVQAALVAAAERWPRDGVPDNPRGWLYSVAVRRLADAVRREAARRRREDAVGAAALADWAFVPGPDADVPAERDDSLVLLLMCCHPALTPPSQIALTLRAVGGLTTAEIARAFLVPEATMAQRISRAKQAIRASGVPFALPAPGERGARLRAVLHVLYLVFNEGYVASAGDALHRADLADEAIRLARALRAGLPREPEVAGLLALMLLTDARRAARTGPHGELVPLDAQDRSRWDRARIAEGTALVEDAMRGTAADGGPGPYAVQAAIAALHDEAARAEDTDWPQILALYEVLRAAGDNPMVALGHAVATAMVRGPAAGLALLDALDGDALLHVDHRFDAVRAHLHVRAGDAARAAAHYRAAAARTASAPERDYLLLKAARVGE